jgi:glycosyltransferase involved in cell wall biosynthesis
VAYIGEALQSAVAHGPSVSDIVVVDDGSTDGSPDVAASLSDPRIRVCRNSGAGVSAARNTGAATASGEWLLFLDADDRLKPRAVDRLLAAAAEAPSAVVVYGDFDRIDAQGRQVGIRRLFQNRPKPSGQVLRAMVRGFFVGNGGTSLVRASAFAQTGGYDVTLKYCEDWHLWCRLAALGEFKYVRGACILDYRIHAANTMDGKSRSYGDYVPALERIWSDPLITRSLAHAERADLRAAAETHLMTYSAGLDVRNHNYWRAARTAGKAMLRTPRRAPGVVARVALARIWV